MTSKTQKIMDVAKPNTLKTASGSGRPVIVSNRPIVQDPMVAPAPAPAAPTAIDDTPPKAEELIKQPQKIVIKPLDDDDTTPEDEPKAAPDEAKDPARELKGEGLDLSPVEEDTGIEEDTPPAEEPAKSASTKPSASTARDDDDEAKPASTEDPIAAEVAAKQTAEAKAQEELDQLIENREYNLPINAAGHRRSRLVAIFGTVLILLLAAAWVDTALDSGILEIPGVQPVTHFFKSK